MRQITRLMSLLLVFLCLSPLGGCSGYLMPKVAVGDAVLTDQTDEAVRLEIPVDLQNPNTEPLELLRFSYSVSVNGSQVYSGKRSAEATLAAGGGKHMILPAIVPLERMGWSGGLPADASWTLRGNLMYVTPGEIAEILLDTGVRKPKVGFSGAGRVVLGPGGEV